MAAALQSHRGGSARQVTLCAARGWGKLNKREGRRHLKDLGFPIVERKRAPLPQGLCYNLSSLLDAPGSNAAASLISQLMFTSFSETSSEEE